MRLIKPAFLFFLFGFIFSAMYRTNLFGGVVDCTTPNYEHMYMFNDLQQCYTKSDPSGYENDAAFTPSPPLTGDTLSYASDYSFFNTKSNSLYYWTGAQTLISAGYVSVDASTLNRACAITTTQEVHLYDSGFTNYQGICLDCTIDDAHTMFFVIGGDNSLFLCTGVNSFAQYSNEVEVKKIDFTRPSDQEWIVALGVDNKIYVIRINTSPYYPEWKEIPTSGDDNGGGYNAFAVAQDGTMCLISDIPVAGGYNVMHASLFTWSCDGIPSHQSDACSGKGICVEEDNCACYSEYYGDGTGNCQDEPLFVEDEDGYTRISGTNETNVIGVYECHTENATISGRNSAAGGYFRNEKMYIFGGEGIDSNGTNGILNDVWRFDNDETEQNWCFIGGSQDAGQPNNIVGEALTFAPTNWPSSRYGTGHFSTMFSLFVFGGADSYDLPNNELWEFQIIGTSQHEWRILHENNNETSDDQPTQRYFPCVGHKTDVSDNVIIFGGETVNSTFLNDLWNYSIQTNSFTRIRESTEIDEFIDNEKFIVEDQYLSQKLLNNNSDLAPPRRSRSICWLDSSETSNFYVFGGEFPNSYSTNDLWTFNSTTQNWIYLDGGTSTFLNTLSLDSKNSFSSLNLPSPRSGSVIFPFFSSQTDPNSILFFGGFEGKRGYDWGDLWVFSNTLLEFKFVNVSSSDIGRRNIGTGNDDIIGSRSFGLGVTKQSNNRIFIFGGRVLVS